MKTNMRKTDVSKQIIALALAAGFALPGAAWAFDTSKINAITPPSLIMAQDHLKKYYEIPGFRIGGKYNLDADPATWRDGGEGGTTLESLGAPPLKVGYIAVGTPKRNDKGEIINAVIVNTFYSGDSTYMYNTWYEGQPANAFSGGAIVGQLGLFGPAESLFRIRVDESTQEADQGLTELEFFKREQAREAIEQMQLGLDLLIKAEPGKGTESGEHFDEHIAEAGKVGLGGGALSGEHFRGGVFQSARLSVRGAPHPEGGTNVNDFYLTGPLNHDVGWFQVTVNQATPMERRDSLQTFTQNGHGHARFESTIDFAGRDDAFVDAGPATLGHRVLNNLEAVPAENVQQINTVNPLHLEHVNALVKLERMNVDQVVHLNTGYQSRHFGHPVHFLVVLSRGFKRGR